MSDLVHSGVGHDDNPPGRGSGRYGWGSGENPFQHEFTFLSEVNRLKKKGLTQSEIAKILLGPNKNSSHLRAEIGIQTKAQRKVRMEYGAKVYEECNWNRSEAARRLGITESTLRSYLDPIKAERTMKYENTAAMLKKVVDKKGIVDVSAGTEHYLGVNENTKRVAISMLENEGYVKTYVMIPQRGTKFETKTMVLAPPGTPWAEIQKNKLNIQSIDEFTPDQGKTWWVPEFPSSLDSKRIYVRYGDEGGKDKDGVIELRRGVDDLSLGKSQYAQVRVMVDNSHYMKGMAIYSNDIPKGYDVVYNTNKKSGTPLMGPDKNNEVLKRLKTNDAGEIDRDNPFGALIKMPKEVDGMLSAGGQSYYTDKDGKKHLSPINKLQDEGDWDSWSRKLSAQFLSKQPLKLINQQIDLSIADRKYELEKIKELTNPVIKQKLLEDFAGSCDSNAADLKVKGFKNQAFQVILPISSLKDNEIYAPKYDNGDTVALVRYPHGGIFEIPILTVNNKHKDAQEIMKGAQDAVGINSKVAEQLSGADFDGDTALVIPLKSNNISVKSRKPLEQLKDFDPKELYKNTDLPKMKDSTKQREMGITTNLITDMTVDGGASWNEIARAVKHSMVVIDAQKHSLDYKQSAKDYGIAELKKRYQSGGASTILSRAKSEAHVEERKIVTRKSDMTPKELKAFNEGKVIYRPTGRTIKRRITDPSKMTSQELEIFNSGKKVYRQTDELATVKVHKMDLVDDATKLVRNKDNPKEMAYARYANTLKGLANDARKEARSIERIKVSSSAAKTYAEEVQSLKTKLRIAQMNAPRERKAQALAGILSKEKFKSNPDMDYEHRQRVEAQSLNKARAMVGAKKDPVVITDREWEAIQANAVTTETLKKILANTDQEAFKKRATPKETKSLSNSEINLIKSLYSSGMYTQKEIADRLGISTSKVSNAVRS